MLSGQQGVVWPREDLVRGGQREQRRGCRRAKAHCAGGGWEVGGGGGGARSTVWLEQDEGGEDDKTWGSEVGSHGLLSGVWLLFEERKALMAGCRPSCLFIRTSTC